MNKLNHLFLAIILCACGAGANKNAVEKTTDSTHTTVTEESATTTKETNELSLETISSTFYQNSHYQGTIDGKHEIYLNIGGEAVSNAKISLSGFYYYTKNKVSIKIEGQENNGKISLKETVYNKNTQSTQTTGYFEGTINSNIFSGTWFSSDRTKQLPFTLTNTATPITSPKVSIQIPEEDDECMGHVIIDNKDTLSFTYYMTMMPEAYGVMEDVNMDGHYDLRVLTSTSPYGSSSYDCWLYNPSTQKYEASPKYSSMMNSDIIFDIYKKEATCSWKDMAYSYGSTIHNIVDGQPLLVKKTFLDVDPETGKTTEVIRTFNIVDGQSVEAKVDTVFGTM